MVKDIIDSQQTAFEKALSHFTEEAGTLRTGRANPGIVENLLVEYYNARTPLVQIASISIPEPRQIVISPWDKGALTQVEAAIRESDLGLNPVNDGSVIRITLPALTEERRRELVKTLNSRAEEARISIRNAREEAWKEIQEAEKGGTISEDEKFRGKDDLQKVIDGFNEKLEAVRERKEGEIMTV
ncbi:MAG: ribosome recycling factor [Candidatus Moraniibacteriota bacterium]|nr:MAG: ribosome recycling factor [Candidatus Moranbacteria bacterium]